MWPPSILCRHVCPQTDYFTLSSARPSFKMEIWRASCPFFTGAKDRCYKGISWTRASEQEGAEGLDRKALQFPQSPQILSRPPSSLASEDPLCLVLHKRGIVSRARGFLGSHYSERKFGMRSPQLKDIAWLQPDSTWWQSGCLRTPLSCPRHSCCSYHWLAHVSEQAILAFGAGVSAHHNLWGGWSCGVGHGFQ